MNAAIVLMQSVGQHAVGVALSVKIT